MLIEKYILSNILCFLWNFPNFPYLYIVSPVWGGLVLESTFIWGSKFQDTCPQSSGMPRLLQPRWRKDSFEDLQPVDLREEEAVAEALRMSLADGEGDEKGTAEEPRFLGRVAGAVNHGMVNDVPYGSVWKYIIPQRMIALKASGGFSSGWWSARGVWSESAPTCVVAVCRTW